MIRPAKLTAAGALALVFASASQGYEYPTIERGFKPERSFQVGDIDNIKLLNGGLEIAIPIGARYPVGPSFSYGLTLHYSNQLWDYLIRDSGLDPGQEPVTQAIPGRGFNAGFGWRLALGEYWDENSTGVGRCARCYVSPSGARHQFYATLHEGQTPDGAWYTRDGTFLRFRNVIYTDEGTQVAGYEIDFPSGEVHRFNGTGRLRHMRDALGNTVDVAHSANAITLTDPYERTQVIHLEAAPHYGTRVDRVTLTGFGGAPVIFDLQYTNLAVPRSCLDDDPLMTSATVTLPILTRVVLPDSSSYDMPPSSYDLTSTGSCIDPLTPVTEGLLLKARLPTLGSVEWLWDVYTFPVPIAEIDKGEVVPMWLSRTTGVSRRTLKRANGAIEAEWIYDQELPGGQFAVESITKVTNPLGDRTDHYFTAGQAETVTYGLPFSPQEDASFAGFPNLKRSTRVFDCGAGGTNCQLLRTTYLQYVSEIPPNIPGLEFNARVAASLTRYHDDPHSVTGVHRYAALSHSNWDGLGNWRESATAGNYESGNVRTTVTNYNPGSGTLPGSFVMPAFNAPWILGDFNYQEVTEAGVTARTESCFEAATGFLERRRTLENGTSPSGTDLLSVFERDSAGFTTIERHYGGDLQGVGTGDCSMSLPAQPQYQLEHSHSAGVRATSRYRNPTNGQLAPYFVLNRTIDAPSGLASSSRDISGIETTYEFDTLGRLRYETPATGHDAWTEYQYTRATSASALAKVEIFRRNQVTPTIVLAESALDFDSFGRVTFESRVDAGTATRSRETTYDGNGWKASVSEWDAPGKKTIYSGYDPLGRPTAITPPDGAGHVVELSYLGDRQVARTVRIATSTDLVNNPIEVSVTTTEVRDRQGRLESVTEPSGPEGEMVTTTYGYDIGNRLASVSTSFEGVTQQRSFTYDRRGFLDSESHPEKTGSVTYSGYDARGHATRKIDGPNDLTYIFDRFERLTEVKRTGAGGLSLKRFTYASTNGQSGSGESLGKLIKAERDNHVVLGATPYTITLRQDLGYHGRAGRLSARTTTNLINGGVADVFSQSVTYNQLGDLASITYPRFGWEAARTINRTYSKGWLTAVTDPSIGTWASFGYHGNGMLSDVFHRNGVEEDHDRDPNSMGRPRAIATIGVVGGGNWSTGMYRYDGAGNITNIGDSAYTYDKVSRIKSAVIPLTESVSGLWNPELALIFSDGFESGDTSAWGQQGQPTAAFQSFVYDAFGNLVEIVGTPGRTIAVNPATNRLSAPGTTHDAAGNVTAWSGNAYTYGPFNETWKTNSSGDEWIHLYDANDQRVWSFGVAGTGANRNRWTLRGFDDKVLREYTFIRSPASWTLDRELIHRGPGQLLAAVLPGGQQRHYHLDHLGSPRLVTDASGAKVAFHSYFPYGEEATPLGQDGTRNKFTGHERDLGNAGSQADDLDYMHARYHNPLVGRFLSVDPAGSSAIPQVPQSWNRYTYARANPVLMRDPDGRKVAVQGDAALALIRGMVPTELSNKVSLGPDQMLRVAAGGSDPNLDGLRTLVGLESTVTVRTGGAFTNGEPFVFESAESIRSQFPDLNPAEVSARIALGETNPIEGGNAEVIVSDGTGEASGVPGVELVKTVAHELLGHALPLLQGRPWLHGDDGVDDKIDEIQKRTEETCGKNNGCGL